MFCIILLDDNRNRNVAYFNWNEKSQRWVLNFNWVDNNYNRNDRFVVPRYCLLTPPIWEEFLLIIAFAILQAFYRLQLKAWK